MGAFSGTGAGGGIGIGAGVGALAQAIGTIKSMTSNNPIINLFIIDSYLLYPAIIITLEGRKG